MYYWTIPVLGWSKNRECEHRKIDNTPLKSIVKKMDPIPHKPWMTSNLKHLKLIRNKAFQRFKIIDNSVHWEYYK